MSIVRFTQARSLTAISAGSLRRHGEYEMRMQMNTTEYGRARWRGPLKKVQKKEQINERGEWMVTETANASNGQHAEAFQEVEEEDSGEKMQPLAPEPSEKREGRFCEEYYGWGFPWPTQQAKK